MEYIVSFVLVLMETISLDNLTSACFKAKKNLKTKLLTFLLYILPTAIIVQEYFRTPSIFKYGIMVLMLLMVFKTLYNVRPMQIITIIFIWYSIHFATESFSMAIYLRVFNLTFKELNSSVVHFILCSVAVRLILCSMTYYFKVWYKKYFETELVTIKEWLMIAIYPISTFLVVVTTIDPTKSKINNSQLLVTIVLVLSNFVLFNLIGSMSAKHKVQQKLLIAQEKVKAEKELSKSLQNSYSLQRSMTHDFNNNILAIKNIADSGDINAVKNFVNKLAVNSNKNALVVKSNNIVVDAVLNQKYSEASIKGVSTSYTINDLSGISIAEDDAVTILSNALDNAITAAEKTKEKIIRVRFTHINGETILRISNSVLEKIEISNNTISTTKDDKINFGYGLKNIKLAIEKYNPIFNIECDNEMFTLSMLIS